MSVVRVAQSVSGIDLGTRVRIADSWWTRLCGQLARPPLEMGEGLLLLGCASVHTFGMAYPIDVAFLDDRGTVVRSFSRLLPWHVGLGGERAVHALELPAGRLEATATVPGVRLDWS